MRTRTPSVYFAGGEPTVRKDLPELTRAARDMNYYPIIINTNGSLIERNLKQEKWHTWLADTDIIIVSLDALDLQLLAKMWVYKRPETVLRNLLLLRELAEEMDFKLMVNTVIQPGHTDEARAVLDFANDMGIWFCPVPQNDGPTIHDGLQADEGYRELAETIIARKKEGELIIGSARMNRRLLYSEPLQCRNTLKPHVDLDGRLAWPCKASVNVKPEYVNVLAHENVESLYSAAGKLVNPNGFHGPAKNQCGANCNWAQNYSTDAYAHGLANPLGMVRDVVDFLRPGRA
jgi:MoaA/NifB/PqqE/SkfB family radical SAM enzyme